MKAIIMAGGEGSRLRPLTCKRPKPLVPVANRPVMEYCLDLLRDLGIKEVGVTLQYLPALIQEYFGDGSDFGLHLHYFVEDKPLGTAGSVKNAASFLDETFVVVSGDALTDFDLRPAIARHKESGALATLVLATVDNPLEYGVVITNPDGSIRSFLEKPSWGEVFSDRVNTGIYILEPEVLELVPEGQSFDFSKDLFPRLLKEKRPLFGVTLSGYWCDIGNLTQYRQAQEDILSGKVKVRVVGEDRGKGVVAGAEVEIDPTARIEGPVLIGSYCRIGPGAAVGPFTVLGPYTRVEEGASVKRSTLWDNVYVGQGAGLRGAVVCSRASLQRQVRIYEGAVIGDGSRVDTGAEVRPEVKIWPEKILSRETVVHESLIWGQGTGRPLFVGSQAPGYLKGDLTPFQVTRMGLAYGASFKPGALVGLSTFAGGAGEMLFKAMAAGLMAAGVKVADLGRLPTPVHRFAVRTLRLAGGCHLKQDATNRDKIWLHLVNERGHDLAPGAVRKIENLYWREDGRQVKEVQATTYFPALKETYRDWLLSTLGDEGIKSRPVRIALGCQGEIAALASEVLQRAGAEVVRLDFDPAKSWGAIQEDIPFFASEIERYGAVLGAAIDQNGEELILFTGEGRRLTPSQQQALLARVYLEANRGAILVLPVTASRAAELVAGYMGGMIERVKSHPGIHQEAMARVDGEAALAQQHLQLDALGALLYILDWLARRDESLAEAVAGLPAIHTVTRTVPCPWEAKGRVMRTLISEEPAERVELLDGVQIRHKDGWSLVFPDGETPHYRIYSEAFSQEMAEELAGFYEQRLRELIAREKDWE
ncbi:MAG: mannose-phosphate guanylyltransferase / phosphomannomutase [Moorella sp. (in: firmicutes)]|jgi:mannose-1-phosphate guanylyltransferase/phosphomannomutase|nr:mannose-phosphate guanylyltransferase / phosphomannomutase [Moorella sp. (in: firmicutes)]MDK2893914.1 mannose-phosphate guanylyltransferase / phosphomannomutase [Moorella sp. (in: firmicutes)]